MESSLEMKIIECLDALEKGDSVDKILARYPHEAGQLHSMLETAVRLSQLNVQPSLAAQTHSRDAFLAEAAALKEAKSTRPSAWFTLRRILRPVASLVMIAIIVGAMLVPLSAAALPGEPLYGAKRFVEDTRLFFTSDPAGKAAFNAQFDQRRIQEINALLAANRDAQVSFEGTIEAIQPDLWIVAGLSLQITDDTQIVGGDPVVGQGAMVNGRTQSGSLIANTVTLSAITQRPTPTPSPTAVPTVTPSSTPTTAPTNTPTPAPEPTTEVIPPTVPPSPSTEPSPTAVIQPTDTPAPPPPTAVPDPDDDDGGDNDNNNGGDGGENDNDGGNDNNDDDGGGGSDENDNGDDNNEGDSGED